MKKKIVIIILSITVVVLTAGVFAVSQYNYAGEYSADDNLSSMESLIMITDDEKASDGAIGDSAETGYSDEKLSEEDVNVDSKAGLDSGETDETAADDLDKKAELMDRPEFSGLFECSGISPVLTNAGLVKEYQGSGEITELVLVHKFQQVEVTMYYYEHHSENLNYYNIIYKKIVLEHDGIFQTFDFDYVYADELIEMDENSYSCYDYDGDGQLEIAVSCMTGYDTGNNGQSSILYIFDLNQEDGKYRIYYLNSTGVENIVEKAVCEFYGSEYGIEYYPVQSIKITAETAAADNAVDDSMPIVMSDNPGSAYSDDEYEYRSRNMLKGDDGSIIEYGSVCNADVYGNGLLIHTQKVVKILPEESKVIFKGYIGEQYISSAEIGCVVCVVNYIDGGRFKAEVLGYKEK